MAKARIEIRLSHVEEELARVMERKLEAAAMIVEGIAIQKLSVGQPVRRTASGRLVGLNPSRPGEPPHVLYGLLRQKMTHQVNRNGTRITADVGSATVYARALELGFVGNNRTLAPRPYLRPSLAEAWPEIVRIFSRL